MAVGNASYLSSPSGIFRLLTVILGFPSMVLVWIAYFSSSWTKAFPEIIAIIIVEKTVNPDKDIFEDDDGGAAEIIDEDVGTTKRTSTSLSSDTSKSDSSSESDYDLISDKEEEYLDEILLQTLMYEKFFIGLVTIVFLISTAYLIVRVISKHPLDSPYEIMFDFIYHVVAALGLLTGSALVLLSAAKIQSFVDQVNNDELNQEIIANIISNKGDVQDKADKITAAAIGMINGILYALCVVTLRMTKPTKIGSKLRLCNKKSNKNHVIVWKKSIGDRDIPRFSVVSLEGQMNNAAYGFYGDYPKSGYE